MSSSSVTSPFFESVIEFKGISLIFFISSKLEGAKKKERQKKTGIIVSVFLNASNVTWPLEKNEKILMMRYRVFVESQKRKLCGSTWKMVVGGDERRHENRILEPNEEKYKTFTWWVEDNLPRMTFAYT